MLTRRTVLVCAAATAIPRGASAQTAPFVRFGTSPAEGYAQPLLAQDAGIFAEDG